MTPPSTDTSRLPEQRRLSPDALICAHYTLGGLEGTLTLEQRAAAVASGGFSYLGWLVDAYTTERDAGRSDADIRAILAHHGVAVAEVEFLFGWATAGDHGIDWQKQEATLLHLADLVGADHLNCGDIGLTGPMLPLDDVAERFAGICDRAGGHGLRVALEFLPWSEIPDAATAWEIVRRAGRANGGVLVDSWHYFRGSSDPAQLAAIPPEHISVVQLADAGPPQGDAMDDTSHRRRPPGEGELPLVDLLSQLDELGVRAPISIEVFSDELDAGPPAEAARRAFAGASSTLATARRSR